MGLGHIVCHCIEAGRRMGRGEDGSCRVSRFSQIIFGQIFFFYTELNSNLLKWRFDIVFVLEN